MQVWIGFFGLEIDQGNEVLPGCVYAYVNALAVADNALEFVARVKEACNELKFLLNEDDDVEPFLERAGAYELGVEIYKLADLAESEGGVVFDTFHGAEDE